MGMNGNLYLLFGTDGFLMKSRTEAILAEHGVDAADVESFDVEEASLEEAVNSAMTIPFLSERKAVLLRNCVFLTAAKGPKEAELPLPYLLRYLQNPSPTTVMILLAPYEKLDTRKQVFRVCEETCRIVECAASKKEDIYAIVKKAVAEAGKTMDADALEEFVNRTDRDASLAVNELDKLLLYADSRSRIDLSMVRTVTTRNLEDNVFELVNAILARDSRTVTRVYQDLSRVGTEPTNILALIIAKFQEILYAKELLRTERGFDDVMKFFNATKGRTYYIVKNAKELTEDQLARYMNELEKIDYRIKSGALDKKIALELFLLGI